MDLADYRFVLLRAGDGQYRRVNVADITFLGAQAARHYDAAIGFEGFSDGFKRLGLGAVYESAGIDDNHIGIIILSGQIVAIGT